MATHIVDGGVGGQYNIVYDATNDEYIYFRHTGMQVIANELIIRNNETNVEVYHQYVESMATRHLVPANTLTNGVTYNAQFIVYWMDDEAYITASEVSDTALIKCYSTPTIVLNNLQNIIRNATYGFSFTANQAEDDYIDHYKTQLYGVDGQVLQDYANVYPATTKLPYTFTTTASNLADMTSYYIECTVTTVSGMSASTGRLPFTVEYERPDAYLMMYVENEYKSCSVRLASNVKVIDGHTLSGNEPKYINGEKADLRDDMAYWEDMIDVSGDFQALLEVDHMQLYQTLFKASNGKNTIEMRMNYSLVEGYSTPKYYLELSVSNGYFNYVTRSNFLTPSPRYNIYQIINKDTDLPTFQAQYLISIVRRGYLYRMSIKKKE